MTSYLWMIDNWNWVDLENLLWIGHYVMDWSLSSFSYYGLVDWNIGWNNWLFLKEDWLRRYLDCCNFVIFHCDIRVIDIRVIDICVIESIVLLRSLLAVPNTFMSFFFLSCRKAKITAFGCCF